MDDAVVRAQLFDVLRRALARKVLGTRVQTPLERRDAARRQLPVADAADVDGDVIGFLRDVDPAVVHVHLEAHVGKSPGKARDQPTQPGDSEVDRHAHAQRPAQLRLHFEDFTGRRIGLLGDAPAMFVERPAYVGRRQRPRSPLHQERAHLPFQRAQFAAHGGLGHAQLFRRPVDALRIDELIEQQKGVEIELHGHRTSSALVPCACRAGVPSAEQHSPIHTLVKRSRFIYLGRLAARA